VLDEVERYSERALGGSQPMLGDEGYATGEVLATLTGFGPQQPYLDHPEVEEIWINEPTKVFGTRIGVTEMVDLPLADTQVRDVVERMLKTSGKWLELSTSVVHTSSPDGSRLHTVIRKPLSLGCCYFVNQCSRRPLRLELQRPVAGAEARWLGRLASDARRARGRAWVLVHDGRSRPYLRDICPVRRGDEIGSRGTAPATTGR
jgi:hypothetical protein